MGYTYNAGQPWLPNPYRRNAYAASIAVEPALEPLSLIEAKEHLRVEYGEENQYIQNLIRSARYTCEQLTQRVYIQRTLDQKHECWAWQLEVFPGPLQTISSVKYFDSDGVEQTVDDSLYFANPAASTYGIRFTTDFTFPTLHLSRPAPITVRYVAGYSTDPLSLPEHIRQAMLLLIGHWFVNRQSVVTGTIATELPLGFETLLGLEAAVTI